MRPFGILMFGLLLLASCAAPGGDGSGETATPVGILPYQTGTHAPSQTVLPPDEEILLPTATPVLYEVVAGDTLAAIAAHYGVTLEALMAANPGILPTALIVGTELVIPTGAALPSEAAPTPAAVFVSQAHCWSETLGGLWCFALITNENTEALENISALFTLLNASGAELTSLSAFAPLDHFPAGASMPLGVYFPPPVDPLAIPRVQVLSAIRLLPGDARYLPVMIQDSLVEVGAGGRSAQVSGRVMLTVLDGRAETIWVLASAFDDSGTLVGYRRWEASAPLAGGESLPFSFLLSSLGAEISRVELLAEARP